MKKFLVEALLAFVTFALSLSLLSTFSFFVAIFPIVVLAVPFICAVTEAFVSFADEKWGFKWDWVVVLGIATITSLPFYPSFVFVASIYMGALGYYIGRRLCARLH
ncbi:hypothetical protein GGR02_003179 [Anoxybacillus voinovskiensis]|uniref:Uncharacterized protein n=1 Tax=Anoxybacteroides voinovskiense TaxID=230470 RepID=A0A840E0T4_9BACL|nr:hypothetical protein [Anoxybacillus voinovskiensis]MBB4075359.1 hypothetical protein [Anoxybacillus voinovskiensis]GGJ78319.1 hypothetical protein GCM10008982_29630 [Anoxybacillus voinovskiensis]